MTTLNNSRVERKSLANEIDRLDNILDGLDEALAGAVEMAVRGVVAEVVKEAVETTVREVLNNPDLIRAVAARHAPVATPAPQHAAAPRKTLKEAIKEKFAWFWHKTKETAGQAKRAIWNAWSWCLAKIRGVGICLAGVPSMCRRTLQTALTGCKLAWQFRKVTALAMVGGVLSGLVAYFAGPLVSSALCGVGGAALTLAGLILWPIYRLLVGENARI